MRTWSASTPTTCGPTLAWPGGTFASYHAYPYYPDFLRYEDWLTTFTSDRSDPYAGYLAALKRHHDGMPVMITELGVPVVHRVGAQRTARS